MVFDSTGPLHDTTLTDAAKVGGCCLPFGILAQATRRISDRRHAVNSRLYLPMRLPRSFLTIMPLWRRVQMSISRAISHNR